MSDLASNEPAKAIGGSVSTRCKTIWNKERESKFTANYIRSKLDYNPGTGEFRWRTRVSQNVREGALAGYWSKSGYLSIKLNRISLMAHRLAWLYQTGQWPDGLIDHKDRNPSNNRWNNLRLATSAQNIVNSKIYRTNSLGVKGVRRVSSGKFFAQIYKNRKQIHLGSFETIEEAARAYEVASRLIYGEFARLK